MRIVFIQTLATPGQCYQVGTEHDLPDDEAARLIAAHVAHEAHEPKKKVTGDKAPAPVKAEKATAPVKHEKHQAPVKAIKGE